MFSFFFFSSRRRHTRCSRDWSSDVCSSDLRRPASVPEESAPPRVGSADLLDAPAQVSRRRANGLLSERLREVLLQRQLAPAAPASAQVLPDDATLIGGKLAVGECGNQLQEPRMFEGGLSHHMS